MEDPTYFYHFSLSLSPVQRTFPGVAIIAASAVVATPTVPHPFRRVLPGRGTKKLEHKTLCKIYFKIYGISKCVSSPPAVLVSIVVVSAMRGWGRRVAAAGASASAAAGGGVGRRRRAPPSERRRPHVRRVAVVVVRRRRLRLRRRLVVVVGVGHEGRVRGRRRRRRGGRGHGKRRQERERGQVRGRGGVGRAVVVHAAGCRGVAVGEDCKLEKEEKYLVTKLNMLQTGTMLVRCRVFL